MEFNNILDCKSKEEFYNWLKNNHQTETECWIECKKGKIKDNDVFYYIDAVYMALCFGWIDSIHRNKDGKTLQKFSPRKKNSPWGELNKERCRWLIKQNLMTESGIKEMPDLDEEFVIEDDILKLLKADETIWNNFNRFPKLYQRIRISNIQRERKKKDVFERMLKHFLEETKSNNIYGEWNDNGRLLND